MDEQAVFAAALECESDEARQEFLREACGDDDVLRERVARLLSIHDGADEFMEKPVLPAEASRGTTEGPGSKIGPYKLLEQIGEGGMGVVYMAAQYEPVRRKVALKIIKPGMDTKQVIARFEAERQALALMEHKNIARVLDAGATESGRPYFVMELVRGIPVTEYCQREQVRTEERLQLFVDVCHAVQHAHQKGIIHRDIKPSNVMVTLHDGEPIVKMIDFGVAKATNQQLTDRTLFTNYAQMIGTPLYMSPEQAEMSGLDVDTRSDIYSLGVLLYELLTDTTPFERSRLKEVGYDEMRRIICEEEPPRPSTRLSTIGANLETVSDQRRSDARRMSQTLRGELDWIVIKALEKNRVRRYQTAKDFADDLHKYLAGEPVDACPPSVLYRLRKQVRKHRGTAAAICVFSLLLVIGSMVATYLAVRATRAEQDADRLKELAQQRAATATAISDFFRKELLGQASPFENPNRDLRLRDVLDRASERIDGQFDGPPLVEAEIRVTLATTYFHLAEFDESARHFDRAYAICVTELGDRHPQTLRVASERAHYMAETAGAEASTEALEETLKKQHSALPANDPDTLYTMARLAWRHVMDSQFDEAQSLFDHAIPATKRRLGPEHPQTLFLLDSLARMYAYQDRLEESEELHTEVSELRRRVLGEEHPQFHDSLAALADLKMVAGKTEEALVLYDRVVGLRRRVQGASHPSTLADERDAAKALREAHRLEAAENGCLESLESHQERFGEDDYRTRYISRMLAAIYEKQGRYQEALPLRAAELESRRRRFGKDDQFALAAVQPLAQLYARLGRIDEAERLQQQVIAIRKKRYGDDDGATKFASIQLAISYRRAGEFEDAERILQQVIQARPQRRGIVDRLAPLRCQVQLGLVDMGRERFADAEQHFREVWDMQSRSRRPGYRLQLQAGTNLAMVLRRQNRLSEAEQLCRDVLQRKFDVFGENHTHTADCIGELARICTQLGRLEEAVELFERGLVVRRKLQGDSHPLVFREIGRLAETATHFERRGARESATNIRERVGEMLQELLTSHRRRFGSEHEVTLNSMSRLANSLRGQRRFEEALILRQEVVDTLGELHGADDQQTLDAAQALVYCLQNIGRLDEAEQIQRESVARQTERSGRQHTKTLDQLMRLGFVYKLNGKPSDAEVVFREIWQAGPTVWHTDHPETLRAGNQLASMLRRLDRLAEAEPICREVLAARIRVLGEDNIDTRYSMDELAEILIDAGRLEEAVDVLKREIEIRRKFSGDRHHDTLDALDRLNRLAVRFRQQGNLKSSITTRKHIHDYYSDVYGADAPRTLKVLRQIISDHKRNGDWQKMYEASTRVIELRGDPDDEDRVPYMAFVSQVEALKGLERLVEAESVARDQVARWDASPPESFRPFASRSNGTLILHGQLADVLIANEQFDEAESVLLKCHELAESADDILPRLRRQLREQLIRLYGDWNKPDELLRWREERDGGPRGK